MDILFKLNPVDSFVPPLLTAGSLFFQPLIVDTLPYPYDEELKGIASASGVPLGM